MRFPLPAGHQDRFKVEPEQERQFAPHLEHVLGSADDPTGQELPTVGIGKAYAECRLLEVLQLQGWVSGRVSGWGFAGYLYSASASLRPRLSLPACGGIFGSH